MGYEYYQPCKEGYEAKKFYKGKSNVCIYTDCKPFQRGHGHMQCDYYAQETRPQPHWVKMWVDGDYLGQYWW